MTYPSDRLRMLPVPVAVILMVATGLFYPALAQTPPRTSEPGYASISPDQYYQLLAERQRLEISSNQQILVIMEAYKGDAVRAFADLQAHEAERRAKRDALFIKYGVKPEQYYRDVRGTSVITERSAYLTAHPEVLEQIVKNSRELSQLQQQVDRRMAPIWYKSAP